jgi:hypothetical protein
LTQDGRLKGVCKSGERMPLMAEMGVAAIAG